MAIVATSVEVTAAWITNIGPMVAGVVGGTLVAWLGFRATRNDRRRERQASLYDKVLNRATYRRRQRTGELNEAASTLEVSKFISKLANSFSPEQSWYAVEATFRAFASRKVIAAYDKVIEANKQLVDTAKGHLSEDPVAAEVKTALDEAIKADNDLIGAITRAYEHRWRIKALAKLKSLPVIRCLIGCFSDR